LRDRGARPGLWRGAEGGRTVGIAFASTIVVFTALGFAVVKAPGWKLVRSQFFSWQHFRDGFP